MKYDLRGKYVDIFCITQPLHFTVLLESPLLLKLYMSKNRHFAEFWINSSFLGAYAYNDENTFSKSAYMFYMKKWHFFIFVSFFRND